jgi:hypothetical protein
MTVTIPYSRQGVWTAEVEHRTTDAVRSPTDAATAKTLAIPVLQNSRLLKSYGQPVNGNGGAAEFHALYKGVPSYGRWAPLGTTIGEALSVGELTSVDLGGEGHAVAWGIYPGVILRITGIVAADDPDRVVQMVVRVTAMDLHEGSPDTIDFEHIWTSISRACDTGATLEKYDTALSPVTHHEDIWEDLSPDVLTDEALDDDEVAINLSTSSGGFVVAGDILRITATGTVSTVVETEVVFVESVAAGTPDVVTVVRGFWGSSAKAFDNDATKLERLNGRITPLKALNTVTDNTRYNPASFDNDYMDFEGNSELLSLVKTPAELRVGVLFGPAVS